EMPRPLESDPAPRPSKPPPPDDGKPRNLQHVLADSKGSVDLRNVFDKDGVRVNALAFVYCRLPSELTLFSGSDDAMWLWINGQQVIHTQADTPAYSQGRRVSLHAGRNTVLAAVEIGNGPFWLAPASGPLMATCSRRCSRTAAEAARFPISSRVAPA